MSPRDALRLPLLRSALALAVVLSASPVLAAGGIGDLYVTSDASDVVRAYDGGSGAFLGVHCTSVSPAAGQLSIHFGETNNRVLVGHFGGGVNEFDATSGAFIKTYNPGGGWMWSALYRPSGNVLATDTGNDKILEFDGVTGALIGTFATFPFQTFPSDMRYGPNGNLYVCSYGTSMVYELDPVTAAIVTAWSMPVAGDRCNDVAFLPGGQIIVSNMGSNMVHRFDSTPVHTYLGSFAGTGWNRPHGIDISPSNGHIFVADGVTTQVHEFDPVTFAEITPTFLSPGPGDKIVDLEFRRVSEPTRSTRSSWGRIKSLYR